MNSLLIVILCIAAIECQKQYTICDVFAPNGVFSGGVKLFRFENQNGIKLIMYKSGENGSQWEVELTQIGERKSIKFIGEAIECCKDIINRFSYKDIRDQTKYYMICILLSVHEIEKYK